MCAGETLRLAEYRPAQAQVRAGAGLRDDELLLRRWAFGSRLPIWFYCGVLPSVHACCLTHSAKQDGLRYAPFLFRAGRNRH